MHNHIMCFRCKEPQTSGCTHPALGWAQPQIPGLWERVDPETRLELFVRAVLFVSELMAAALPKGYSTPLLV